MHAVKFDLQPVDKIAVVGFMEDETLKKAIKKGFKGIFTTNTNALNQQLGKNILGFETLETVQVNQYVNELGKKPFGKALDHHVVMVMYKDLK